MTEPAVPGATFDIVSVKGLGDLVIALTCLRAVARDARARLRFLLDRRLLLLWEALDPPFASMVLDQPDRGAPALFQARSRPLASVVLSALDLRLALGRARHPASTLVFDEWDVRHRFLTLGRRGQGLPERANLYERWNAWLAAEGLASPGAMPVAAAHGRRLHIFPGAREADRRLAVPLLRDLFARAARTGLDARVFTVAGEMGHLKDAGLPLEEMPRDFAATVAAVSCADRVVSADSMTAHLAEYCGKPVFVLSPTLKYYWLPLSAAREGRHALFGDGARGAAVSAFLHRDLA